ncbi:hypothetical protein D3C71_601470 [compost metagenome]|jgi:hypothetical protein
MKQGSSEEQKSIQAIFAGSATVLQAFNAMRNADCFCRTGLDFEGLLKDARSPIPKVLKGRPILKMLRLHLRIQLIHSSLMHNVKL